jgi:hypothetical protein
MTTINYALNFKQFINQLFEMERILLRIAAQSP